MASERGLTFRFAWLTQVALAWLALSASLFAWRASHLPSARSAVVTWGTHGATAEGDVLVTVDSRRELLSGGRQYGTLAQWSATLPESLPRSVQVEIAGDVPSIALRQLIDVLAKRGVRQVTVAVSPAASSPGHKE